jgi:hypothetical protein
VIKNEKKETKKAAMQLPFSLMQTLEVEMEANACIQHHPRTRDYLYIQAHIHK